MLGERLMESVVEHPEILLNKKRDFEGVVIIGEGLAAQLFNLASTFREGCTSEAIAGPSPVHGEFWDTHHLYFVCDGKRALGIRLKYEKRIDKFHIRGFWSPNRNDKSRQPTGSVGG